jgi:hypothetical protein
MDKQDGQRPYLHANATNANANDVESLDCPAIDRSVSKSNELACKGEHRLSLQLCHCVLYTKGSLRAIDFTFLSQTSLLEIVFRKELGTAIYYSVAKGNLHLSSLCAKMTVLPDNMNILFSNRYMFRSYDQPEDGHKTDTCSGY